MIEITLAHSDLARVRFAHSPVEELVASLRVLQDPGRQLMYGRWVSATRDRLGGLRLDLLAALAPTGRYLPAFLFPPSTRPWGVLSEELAQIAASPPAVVRAELDKVREGAPLPAVLGPLYDDPAGQLPAVVEELGRYWEAAIEPVWPRVRGLCAADLAYRMEQFAGGGLARVLGDLHPDLGFAGELLRVDKPHHCSHHFDLAGTGIVLVPCAFTWPSLSVDCCGVDQPALIYPPARGGRAVGGHHGRAARSRSAPWSGGPGPASWPSWRCRGPPPSWRSGSSSARPRSASTSRSSRTPPWSAPTAAAGWSSTSAPPPPPPCWRPSPPTRPAAADARTAAAAFVRLDHPGRPATMS